MAVFDAPTAGFLEGGCALIIGLVDDDGEPYATRGWGLDVLTERRVRVLLAAEDEGALTRVASGAAVAVTACDVPTLRSMQLKGRSLGLEVATDEDRMRAGRYVEAFFTDITHVDRMPRHLVEQLEPAGYVPLIIEIDEQYDQTPGPSAGARLGTASS